MLRTILDAALGAGRLPSSTDCPPASVSSRRQSKYGYSSSRRRDFSRIAGNCKTALQTWPGSTRNSKRPQWKGDLTAKANRRLNQKLMDDIRKAAASDVMIRLPLIHSRPMHETTFSATSAPSLQILLAFYRLRFRCQIVAVSTVANATQPTSGRPAREAAASTFFASLTKLMLLATNDAAATVLTAN
jgi:hypothetical protein